MHAVAPSDGLSAARGKRRACPQGCDRSGARRSACGWTNSCTRLDIQPQHEDSQHNTFYLSAVLAGPPLKPMREAQSSQLLSSAEVRLSTHDSRGQPVCRGAPCWRWKEPVRREAMVLQHRQMCSCWWRRPHCAPPPTVRCTNLGIRLASAPSKGNSGTSITQQHQQSSFQLRGRSAASVCTSPSARRSYIVDGRYPTNFEILPLEGPLFTPPGSAVALLWHCGAVVEKECAAYIKSCARKNGRYMHREYRGHSPDEFDVVIPCSRRQLLWPISHASTLLP